MALVKPLQTMETTAYRGEKLVLPSAIPLRTRDFFRGHVNLAAEHNLSMRVRLLGPDVQIRCWVTGMHSTFHKGVCALVSKPSVIGTMDKKTPLST